MNINNDQLWVKVIKKVRAWARLNSVWAVHFNSGSCNGCDIETGERKLTHTGELFCQRIGVDVPGARRAGSRHFARQCLDWSERRPHISGSLGAAIADTFFRRGWAEKLRRSRTVRLTDSGRRAMGSHFGAALQ